MFDMKALWIRFFILVCALGVALAAWVVPTNTLAATTYVKIGTGGVAGKYYLTGIVLARVINKRRVEHGVRMTVQSTDGSAFNVNAVVSKDLEFGIVHSDRQYQAVHGLAEWEDSGEQDGLRVICSLYSESVTLVAAIEGGITTVDDLQGKIVNIGEPGSGNRQNAIDVLKAIDLDYQKDLTFENADTAHVPQMLQDGQIDAFFYTVGHPNQVLREVTAGSKKARFIPIEGRNINKLIRALPYYAKDVVPIDAYPQAGNTEDIPTIGTKATLMTGMDVPDDIVYAVTKSLFENLEELKSLHPTLMRLTKEDMFDGLSAPIHPGALQYYQEAGLSRLIPRALR
jgi:TRAP transporter TAXI family solute receptor